MIKWRPIGRHFIICQLAAVTVLVLILILILVIVIVLILILILILIIHNYGPPNLYFGGCTAYLVCPGD